jgi:hypothetical protein
MMMETPESSSASSFLSVFAWCSRSALAASSRRITLCRSAGWLWLWLCCFQGWHAHPRPRPAAPSVPRGVRVYLVLPCTSAYLPVCPWFDLCRRLICPQSHCSIFPRCSPPFVLRLVLPPACSTATRPVCFLDPPYIHPRLIIPIPAHTQRHAHCCPPPHHHHHGSLDIQQQQPHPIAKQCSATARMGDRQCHVKSINSSRQCNTATPAPALLLWHTSTAARPPTKQSFAPK